MTEFHSGTLVLDRIEQWLPQPTGKLVAKEGDVD